MLLDLDEDDTMTPTERKLMAEVGDEGESSEQEEVSKRRSRRTRKGVQDTETGSQYSHQYNIII